jgi:hypothetical protein
MEINVLNSVRYKKKFEKYNWLLTSIDARRRCRSPWAPTFGVHVLYGGVPTLFASGTEFKLILWGGYSACYSAENPWQVRCTDAYVRTRVTSRADSSGAAQTALPVRVFLRPTCEPGGIAARWSAPLQARRRIRISFYSDIPRPGLAATGDV